MIRTYTIEWYPTKENKYKSNPTTRINRVRISKPTGRVEIDAKAALNLFIASFGNLNKNTIIKIKEFGEDGKQIGEDITPSNKENAVIPLGKNK